MADNFGMGDVDGSVTKVQEWLSRQMRRSQGPTQPTILQKELTILQNPEYYRTHNTTEPRIQQNPEYNGILKTTLPY